MGHRRPEWVRCFSRLTSCLTGINGLAAASAYIDHMSFAVNMKFFADPRTKRNTAFVVLLVWLFALASSVANACLLETHEPHSRAATQSAASANQAPAELQARMGTAASHHDDSDGSKESCLKVCDDGTHTLLKAYPGGDDIDPGPASLFATLWTGSPDVISAPRRMDDLAIPIVGPPLRVRYSRLAL